MAIFVAAMSGALLAYFKKLDLIASLSLAMLTALGGGTLRDILLQRTIFWIETPHYIWVAVLASLFTTIYTSNHKPPLKLLLICDAIGLAFFTILGAQVAVAEGHSSSWAIIIIMALLTGVSGGVLRDIFANEIPYLFRATESLYSIVSLIGVVSYLLLKQIGFTAEIVNTLSISIIIVLRLLAIYYNIRLPQFKVKST